MSNQPWQQTFNVEDLSSNYRGDLDPEKIVWLQIQRCNLLHSQGDEMLYGNAVMSLLINVPEDIRIEVEDQEPEYHTKEMAWKPKLIDGEYGGADPDNPDMMNIRGSLRYNPHFRGRHYEKVTIKTRDKDKKEIEIMEIKEVYEIGGPHQVSPIYVEDERWDYYTLQKLIMAALQGHGLTWKKERTEIFTGEEWDPAFDPPEEEEENEGPQPEEEEKTPERKQPPQN